MSHKQHRETSHHQEARATLSALVSVATTGLALCVFADPTTDCNWQPAYDQQFAVCHNNSDCAQDIINGGCSYTTYDSLITCDCGSNKCVDDQNVSYTNVGQTPYTGGTCTKGWCSSATPGAKSSLPSAKQKDQNTCSS